MEDALAQARNFFNTEFGKGLNPCCNGRCTRTKAQTTVKIA